MLDTNSINFGLPPQNMNLQAYKLVWYPIDGSLGDGCKLYTSLVVEILVEQIVQPMILATMETSGSDLSASKLQANVRFANQNY